MIAVFAYWPIVYNAYLGLTDWNMIAVRPTFVGLANYARTFTDPAFHQTLWVTVAFTGLIVAGSLLIGLALAGLLTQTLIGSRIVELHERGLDVTAWPVPDEHVLATAVELAVDGFTIDHPDRVRTLVS